MPDVGPGPAATLNPAGVQLLSGAHGVGAFKTALMLQGVIATNQVPEPFSALKDRDVEGVGAVLDAWRPAARRLRRRAPVG